MGLSPRVVTEDVTFTWDGVPARLPKGQVIDVEPGSPLERAIGAGRLVPYGLPPASQPPVAETPAPAAEDAPPKPAEPPTEPAEPATAPQGKPPVFPPRIAPPVEQQETAKDGDW